MVITENKFSNYENYIGGTVFNIFSKGKILDLRKNLFTTYSQLIHQLHYARFISEENRREIWPETVLRFMNFIYEQCLDFNYKLTEEEFLSLYKNIINLEILPSMRLLWCAGDAVRKNAVSNFNCAFLGIKDPITFSEILFLGMSGTGVGFSVENKYISKLGIIKPLQYVDPNKYLIEDSREGWALALHDLIKSLYQGVQIDFDFSALRPAGTRLSTAGGFSSGPECLQNLFSYTKNLFKNAQSRSLTSLECHDLVCKTAETAVAGGTRRCLPSGTIVSTELGFKNIEDIQVGELVLSYDKGKIVKKKVLAKEKVGRRMLTNIKTKFGEVYCTAEHRWPVMIDELSKTIIFKQTKDIVKGDYLILFKHNKFIQIKVNEDPQLTGRIKICWDLQIEDTELFIADNFLTHNSALISFSDFQDKQMQTAKSGEWWKEYPHRSLANNSAVYTKIPSSENFEQEWNNLVESKSGERGIFNEVSVLKKIKQLGRRDPEKTYRSNPCFSADTLIVTKEGIFPINELVGKTVDIWNGEYWEQVDNFRCTGTHQPLLKLKLMDGSKIELTYDHTCILETGERIPAKYLKIGMKLKKAYYPEIQNKDENVSNICYLKGILFSLGEICPGTDKPYLRLPFIFNKIFNQLEEELKRIPVDTVNSPTVSIFEKTQFGESILVGVGERSKVLKKWCKDYKKSFNLEILSWSHADRIDFLSGVFDGQGIAIDSVDSISYALIFEKESMAQHFQILLHSIGITSIIYLLHTTKEYKLFIFDREAVKLSNKLYFNRLVSFKEKMILPHFIIQENEIEEIIPTGITSEVYCCTVASNNSFSTGSGLVFGNCSEIQLQDRQFCNLSNVIIRPHDTVQSVSKKIELATILGTIQSTLTNFPYLDSEWRKTTEEERLLGVSLSGIADNSIFFPKKYRHLPHMLSLLRQKAVSTNRKWAHKLGIPTSNAVTTIKPSGDSSQLTNCASGIHPRYAPFYVRTIRMNVNDPIAQQLMERNFFYEYSHQNKEILIFSFPQKSPKNTKIFSSNLKAVDHINLWLQYARYWSEHMVSCTIMVRSAEEWEQVKWKIYNTFNEICGLSFLPYNDHIYPQAPYQEIQEEEYYKQLKNIPIIDFSTFKEYQDNTNAPIACDSETGICSIKSI